jgi:type II secretory pathway pseudopilin PulG
LYRKIGKKAATLLELIYSVLILGILAGIAIPIMSGSIGKNAENMGVEILRSIRAAERSFFLHDSDGDGLRNYTADLVDTRLNLKGPVQDLGGGLFNVFGNSDYIFSVPLDVGLGPRIYADRVGGSAAEDRQIVFDSGLLYDGNGNLL